MPALPAPVDPLRHALDLAHGAIGLSDPNPRVGCVITSADGRWQLGSGHTQAAGSAHAEVMALRDATARGQDVRGGTAYVTLEPCSHHGRTPPCCDALIAAGLARVVVATGDPNPAVNGQGIARLRAAGLLVEMGPADLADAARELNIGFHSRMERGRPWLRLKTAGSLDGRSALPNGTSQWITGEAARHDGHAWRRRAGLVLTGIGTALADQPRLDVRHVPTTLQPRRALVDARLQLPPDAPLLDSPGGLLVYTLDTEQPGAERLRQRGAELVAAPGNQGRVDLQQVLADLARRPLNEVHIEAGARLNAAWLASGLVDEVLHYLAPVWLGEGLPLASLGPWTSLAQTLRWRFHHSQALGPDLRLLLRPSSRVTASQLAS